MFDIKFIFSMKLKATYLLVLFAVLFTTAASAQVDRRIGQGQYRRGSQKQGKVDYAEESANYLQKELKLDDFQKAAVKNILNDEKDAVTALGENKDMTDMERRDKYREISQRIYKKVFPLLSKEQGEKYTKMEESRKI